MGWILVSQLSPTGFDGIVLLSADAGIDSYGSRRASHFVMLHHHLLQYVSRYISWIGHASHFIAFHHCCSVSREKSHGPATLHISSYLFVFHHHLLQCVSRDIPWDQPHGRTAIKLFGTFSIYMFFVSLPSITGRSNQSDRSDRVSPKAIAFARLP